MLDRLRKYFRKEKPKEQQFSAAREEDVIARGRQAEDLLKNPALMDVIQRYEFDLYRDWLNTTPDEIDRREAQWHERKALEKVKLKLTGAVNQMIAEKQKIAEDKAMKGAAHDGR